MNKLGGCELQNMISQLEQVAFKLYRLEIQEAIMKWNNIIEEFAKLVESMDNKEAVLEILKIIVATVENKDYVLMADLIRYDLVKIIEEVN